jgi:nitrous oxide reductase accessory protein NosL
MNKKLIAAVAMALSVAACVQNAPAPAPTDAAGGNTGRNTDTKQN